MPSPALVYKICSRAEWDAAVAVGVYTGSAHDVRDGFIHFSFAHQLAVTAAKHFAGREDLVLVTLDPTRLGDALRYEAARSGDVFPHLHGPLDPRAAIRVQALPWRGDAHAIPDLVVGAGASD